MAISGDYETYLIGNEAVFPAPVCLSTYDGTNAYLWDKHEAEQELKKILNKELFIAHNAVFECGVTVTHYPDLAELVFDALDNGLIYCTKINEQIWNTQRQKQNKQLSLAELVMHYYQKDISEAKTDPQAWRLRYSELDGIPLSEWPIEASQYAIDDSIWAYKVFLKQQPISQILALKTAVHLNLMGAQGFRTDQSRVLKLEEEIKTFLTPRYELLAKEKFCEFKKGKWSKKTKALKEHILSLGVELEYTEKGGISTAADSLASYQNQVDDPILKAFSELSQYETIMSNFVSHLKGAPKIYTQYNTVLNTGRTSSSSSKLFDSVNIQNQPGEVKNVTYDVRGCYVPRPGFKIFSVDYSGLELCSASHQLYMKVGYSKMRDMLNSGTKPVDPHSNLAARRKGMPYEEFMKRKAEFKEERNKAKPLNLSFPGGVGYDTMRHLMYKAGITTHFKVLEKARRKTDLYYFLTNLGVPDLRIKRLNQKEYALVQDELVGMKRDLFDAYPELEEFLKETHKKFLTGRTRFKKNEFGEWEEEEMYRYETHGFVRDWCTYTAMCNGFLMQTPAAVGATKAMCKIHREFYNNPNIFPQAFVHDEGIGEVREDCYDLVERVGQIMIEEMQTVLPSVRISVEASVSDVWQKADGFWTKKMWEDAK